MQRYAPSITLAHDLATGHFYKDIADNDDWSIEDTPENRCELQCRECTKPLGHSDTGAG